MAEEGEPGAAVHLPLDHLVLVLTPADRGPGVCQFTLQSRDGDRTGREHPIELTDPEILATVGPPSTHPLNEGWPCDPAWCLSVSKRVRRTRRFI